MKRITNKLFISILTVAFAVIALGSTTFAWFTLNNVATISNFNASITAGEGIEMSLDGSTWTTLLTQTDMENHIYMNKYPNFKFSAVTSADGFTSFQKINPVNTAYIGASATSETGGAGADYLTLKIYFRSVAGTVGINWTGATLTSVSSDWTPDASFTNSTGTAIAPSGDPLAYTPISINGADAARISIDGDVDVIYEPTPTVTGKLGLEGDLSTGEPSNGAVSYFQAKNQTVSPFGATTVTIANALDLSTVQAANSATVLASVDASGTDFLMIRIWIEGWDPDCFNAILNRQLTIGLVFTKVTV